MQLGLFTAAVESFPRSLEQEPFSGPYTELLVFAHGLAAQLLIMAQPTRQEAISMASTSSSSLSPPEVPMELHVSNRQKLLNSLRHHLSESSRHLHGFVFLQVLLYHTFFFQ